MKVSDSFMRIRSIKFWATILILLICITTMSLFGVLSLNNLHKSLEKQYKNESEFVLKQTVLSFEHQFSNVENIIEQLAQSQILKSDQSSGIMDYCFTTNLSKNFAN